MEKSTKYTIGATMFIAVGLIDAVMSAYPESDIALALGALLFIFAWVES